MPIRSLIAETIRPIRRELKSALRTWRVNFSRGDRLHLGCGSNLMPGWLNVDLDTPGAIDWDLSRPIPLPTGSIRFIYSEHFIEHITREQGLAHLRECHRLLGKGGVLRISTPDLRALAEQYLSGNLDEWIEAHWRPETPARLLNEALRSWGHQFVYDEAELFNALRVVGFALVRRVLWRQSDHPALRNLETRPFHRDLIVEATK
jgi:predicted SAM-dependent methyltransferase